MNKRYAIVVAIVVAALFLLPFVHRIFWPVDDEYFNGISRANEDALIPSITASVLPSGSGGENILTCKGDYDTDTRLRPYTFFMIPQRIVFVCAKIDDSGVVEGINLAGYLPSK